RAQCTQSGRWLSVRRRAWPRPPTVAASTFPPALQGRQSCWRHQSSTRPTPIQFCPRFRDSNVGSVEGKKLLEELRLVDSREGCHRRLPARREQRLTRLLLLLERSVQLL